MDFEGLLKWRCIGPYRGGRVVAVSGDVNEKNTYYFGACAGGVWKTVDGGMYWDCVSDGFFKTSSVGALAVSEADPNVIYAGMGETTIRIDVSHGDGVYKSTDAGKTWRHMGLADTRHIAKIRIHPQNPDIVWVAAFGHAFGEHKERGVYKSVDGGQSWRQVLFKSNKAGAIDLSLDPNNPRILYASIWQAYRNFWQISSGGEDSGLYKSLDGGESWQEISRNEGLPTGMLGKMGIAVSPANSERVWAIIENSEAGGLYRSDDGGDTWEQTSSDQKLISRAWYYMHLTPDPQDADTLYVNNLSFWKSSDAGKTFIEIGTPHGDNHDLWIDPENPARMIQSNDGGANVSLNSGATWSSVYNQPTAQFYHLETDNQRPYRVYGTQQDNSSISVPSRGPNQSISWSDCYTAGTGESGYIAPHPEDANIVYVGAVGSSPGGGNSLQRYDHRRKQIRLITTWPEDMTGRAAAEEKYRFAWTYPIFFSPHDSNTLYISGNQVFKTTDEGQSWQVISPDLTRADPDTLEASGGPINKDAVGAETYATVFALAESPRKQGLLWAGSDDGLVHLSRDGGQSWHEVTPKQLPKQALVSMLEPSHSDPASCYLAATCYKHDDYQPYLFKTSNYGKSWSRISKGIDEAHFTRAIREDPNREGLLFAGTECGLYCSLDAGKSWQRFQLNLPVCPIYDLKIKDNDLVVATHGRSFWILDDITPLQQYHASLAKETAHLFAPRESIRILPQVFEGGFGGAPGKNYMGSLGIVAAYYHQKTAEGADDIRYLDTGENPPKGAVICYYLKETAEEKISLSIKDQQGNILRTFYSLNDKEKAALKDDGHAELGLPARAGYNRFIWDLRLPTLTKIEGDDVMGKMVVKAAMVVPGDYQLSLTVAGTAYDQPLRVVADPMANGVELADLAAQHKLWKAITDKAEETIAVINQMRDLRDQLKSWEKRSHKDVATKVTKLKDKVRALEEKLAMPEMRPGWPDSMNAGARLLDKLLSLIPVVSIGDYKPTTQAEAAFEDFSARIDKEIKSFHKLLANDLAKVNQAMKDQDIANIVIH